MEERQKLLKLLTKYKLLFDGTLGTGEKMKQSTWSSNQMPNLITIIHIVLLKSIEKPFKKSWNDSARLVLFVNAMKEASGELLAFLFPRRMELCGSSPILGS